MVTFALNYAKPTKKMRKSFTIYIAIAAFLQSMLLAGCGSQEPPRTTALPQGTSLPIDTALATRLKAFANAPRVKGKFGFYVYDLDARKPVYGVQEHLSQPSASCMKLLTGIAGLHLLGTDYYFKTHLFTRGATTGGTLNGDIALKTGLDPQIRETDLRSFAAILAGRGIRRVTGKVYLDLLLTQPVKSENHWYPWDLTFSQYGIFYKGAHQVAKAFRSALRQEGVVVADSQIVMGPVPQGSHCVYLFRRRIDTVLKRMWKNSSNTQATSLLYAIGHHINPKADPVETGVAYLRTFLNKDLNQTDTTLVVHDGCGLCPHNRLSPAALVSILEYGYDHPPIRRELLRLLAISGQDGTLRRAIYDPKLRGRILGKTGTLSHPFGISSLAGFCRGNDGHMLAFAIMDSEMSVLDAHVLQRRFCTLIAKSDDTPAR